MRDQPESPAFGEVIKAAGFVLGLITAWLYFAGWSYAYAYFDHFRILLLMVDLPIEHVFVYGGLVLWKNWLPALALFLLLAAAAWACCRYAADLGRFGLSAIAVALVLLLFALGRWGGVSTAWNDFQIQRAGDFPAYPRVRLVPPRMRRAAMPKPWPISSPATAAGCSCTTRSACF